MCKMRADKLNIPVNCKEMRLNFKNILWWKSGTTVRRLHPGLW